MDIISTILTNIALDVVHSKTAKTNCILHKIIIKKYISFYRYMFFVSSKLYLVHNPCT